MASFIAGCSAPLQIPRFVMFATGFGLTMTATGALLQSSPDLKIMSCDATAFPEALPAVKVYLPPEPPTTDVPIVLFAEPASFIIQLPDAPGSTLLTVKISGRTSPEQRLVKTTPEGSETDGVGLTARSRGTLAQFPDLKVIFCDTGLPPATLPAVKLYLPPTPATTDVPIVLLAEPASFITQLPKAPGTSLLTPKTSL